MLLIIPAIDIENGVSAYPMEGLEGDGVGTDPVGIARLLRVENAKTLHVTDLDGARRGSFTQFDLVSRLVASVDIPIEISGGISSEEDAGRLLDSGACRIVLRPGLIAELPETAARIVGRYGAGKVVAAIEHRAPPEGVSVDERSPGHPLALGAVAKKMGFRRLLYTELDRSGGLRILNARMLERLARSSGLRVTVSGGVISLDDLRAVEALGPAGVDSVILRRAIYENRFSCQAIWRLAEKGRYPFTAKV
ncbi:MAG TPA: HisA/HisF-related TIM barrel protein [Bacteroidota bacterium]|nr:HisA/HisF-related TIM barrel protein [Bacteroidota bacterium]